MIPQTAIFSRRMVRDAKASEKARIFGSRGGNPALKRVNPTHSLEAEAEAEADMISPASQAHPAGKPDGASRASKPKPELKPRRPPAMDGFEEFWRHYPRKVGKGEAERAWPRALAAAGGDVDLIIGGVKVALGTDRLDMREGGRFCPHPATWLNGKRWLDGLDPEPDPQPTLLPRH